ERGSHHEILCAGNRREIEIHFGATKTPATSRSFSEHVAALETNRASHGLEAFQMLIDRTRADLAAARQRYLRTTKSCDERAEHEYTRTHCFDELVRRFWFHLRSGRNVHLGRIEFDVATEETKKRRCRLHVAKLWHVAKLARAIGKQRRAQNGKR